MQIRQPFKEAVDLYPATYLRSGRNYNLAGMYLQAESVLRQFIELVPDDPQAHYELGFAMLQQFSKRSEAIEHFRNAVKLCPQHQGAYHFLCFALVRYAGDFAGARELLDELKESHPKQAEDLAHLISLSEPARLDS